MPHHEPSPQHSGILHLRCAKSSEYPNTQYFLLNHSFLRPAPAPAHTEIQRLARYRVAFLEFLGRTRANVLFYEEFLGLLLAQHQLLLAGGHI